MQPTEWDLRDLDRRALAATGAVIAGVTVAHLDLPTPCAGWTLGDLLRHMVGHNHGFAAAGRGRPEVALWDGVPLGDEPAAAYERSAADVTASFSATDFLERTVDVHGYGIFPGSVAIRMHFVDFLVHGWDVAKSIGADTTLDEGLSLAGLRIASRWPETAWGPTGPFRSRVPVPDDAPAGERLVGFLGRSPKWTP
jgi:uncharacterized protein (TIGR03086 family)